MPTFSIVTLGCKVNQYESGKIIEKLRKAGFQESRFGSKCDIFIINTCSVTQIADKKSRQKIRQSLKLNPLGQVIVTGCSVEYDGSRIKEISDRIAIVQNKDKDNILNFITNNDHSEILPSSFEIVGRTRALLKIQDGCNRFCSYCIVPYVRGKPTSKPFDEALKEAVALSESGYREIVLTGIHLGAYGTDLYGTRKLPELLIALSNNLNDVRIRMSSIEPDDFHKEIIEVMKKFPQICPHIHLPLQHASPAILERMERRYTIQEYERIIESIYENLPETAITSDIIVGFPGETEEDFEALLKFIDKTNFYHIHVFKYSPRFGTKAARFRDQVSEAVKSKRSSLAIEIGIEKTKQFCRRFIGKRVEILVEKAEGDQLSGLSQNYLKVHFRGDSALKGEFVPVDITQSMGMSLKGELAKRG